jgi:hypothetical protein
MSNENCRVLDAISELLREADRAGRKPKRIELSDEAQRDLLNSTYSSADRLMGQKLEWCSDTKQDSYVSIVLEATGCRTVEKAHYPLDMFKKVNTPFNHTE